MDKTAGNAIYRARKLRGLTQEALGTAVGYSPDTIAAFEAGARLAPIEALDNMAALLSADWLTATYLREQYSTGALAEIIPCFVVGRPLAEAAAEYINAMLDMMDRRFDRELLRMIADGRIDDLEQPVFAAIIEQGAKINSAFYTLKYAKARCAP